MAAAAWFDRAAHALTGGHSGRADAPLLYAAAFTPPLTCTARTTLCHQRRPASTTRYQPRHATARGLQHGSYYSSAPAIYLLLLLCYCSFVAAYISFGASPLLPLRDGFRGDVRRAAADLRGLGCSATLAVGGFLLCQRLAVKPWLGCFAPACTPAAPGTVRLVGSVLA